MFFLENGADDDTGKAPSILSVDSVTSAISSLSLGSGWNFWKQQSNTPSASETSIKDDVLHIFRFLTQIPTLRLYAREQIHTDNGISQRSGYRGIRGFEGPLAKDGSIRLSLAHFKKLAYLELDRIHPKQITNWEVFAPRLISLVVKRAEIEDVTEILRISDLHPSSFSTLLMLSLQDNNLTTVEPTSLLQLQSITHLNLSCNLLIDVPHSLSLLYNLQSLNLSHNMISSTSGINTVLGNIQELVLTSNRLTKLVGIDRLWALERLDIRNNRVEDAMEISRLLALPNLEELWVVGNPFTAAHVRPYSPIALVNSPPLLLPLPQTAHRIDIFSRFLQHDRPIRLDGYGPSFAEKLRIHSFIDNSSQKNQSSTPVAHPVHDPSPLRGSEPNVDNHLDSHCPESHMGTDSPELKLSKTRSRKHKRMVRLRRDTLEPSRMDSEQPAHVHRYAELQKSFQASPPASFITEMNKSELSAKSNLPSSSELVAESSGVVPPAGDGFRQRIELMRQEAGTGWLRVLKEMNDKRQ
ncbi:hypothetical protein DM01DRAFT_1347023 [Hesseltinella vesiculosa]|uniref:L domain-like protein n=1 Tax=Hesseltinella vesiculosa TaxID=101127 RepID=A0A1X2GD98_9FUNG|nr:hypothetical protein DM01DRAFT_1347023 [Hesseltinella vesiculosa]